MPADLTKPFGESCCDGGECDIKQTSAQPCGCDPGLLKDGKVVGYLCSLHAEMAEAYKQYVLDQDANKST